MRVGVNTLFLLPGEVGGSEPYTRNLLDAIAAHHPETSLVLFTNRENHASFASFERVLVDVHARSRPVRVLAEQMRLPGLARKAHIDLLFSPGYTTPYRMPVPSVVSIFDTQFRHETAQFSFTAQTVHNLLVGVPARRAARVLTLTEFGKSEICTYLGVPAQRITVTPPGPGNRSRPRGQAPMEQPYLLTVANSYPHKNLHRLRDAIANLPPHIPHRWVLIGQPRAGEPAHHERIRRIHRCSEEDLATYFTHCAAYVHPSHYEGFGLPVLEALAFGARVGASDIPPLHEIAGGCARYFDPNSTESCQRTLHELIDEDPTARGEHIENGKIRAERFTWKGCAERTVAAFQSALDRPSAR